MIVGVACSRKVQRFLDLVNIQIKGAVGDVGVGRDAEEGFELLLGRNVGDELADSFADERHCVSHRMRVQDFPRHLESHADGLTVLCLDDLENKVRDLFGLDEIAQQLVVEERDDSVNHLESFDPELRVDAGFVDLKDARQQVLSNSSKGCSVFR